MKNGFGFSLLELIIALAIIGILTAIALPTYRHHVNKTYTLEAKAQLQHTADALENYHLLHHTYEGATLTNLQINSRVAEGQYHLSLRNLSNVTFEVVATPTSDPLKKLHINQLGAT